MTPELVKVALSAMEELDCPRSLTVAILLRAREFRQIASLRCTPNHYNSANSYFRAAQATDLLRKVQSLDTGIDRKAAARVRWEDAERSNFLTNYRLKDYLYTPLRRTEVASIENFVLDVRNFVRKVLGKIPADLTPRFGPGATVSDKTGWVSVPDKLTSHPTATPDCDFLYSLWEETAWGRSAVRRGQGSWIATRGNVFFTVPKDGETDRACAKGPSINVAYQLAVGKCIRRRLRLIGIDLDHGQHTHRQVACRASLDGLTASIDLTNASDCVSESLVRLFLPPDWFDLLSWLREPFTKLPDGKWRRLEKFSAMGNGFTFELETLLFAAIVQCIDSSVKLGSNAWVYGDDILVPTHVTKTLEAALSFFGFSFNRKKSFSEGPFRESCGGDFWSGEDVRPYQMQEFPSNPEQWIGFANGWRRALRKAGIGLKTWFMILDQIPTSIRCLRGPEDLGDLVVHDDLVHWVTRERNSIRYVKTYSPVSFRRLRWNGYSHDIQSASSLYGPVWSEFGNDARSRHTVPRDGVIGYGPRWIPFS